MNYIELEDVEPQMLSLMQPPNEIIGPATCSDNVEKFNFSSSSGGTVMQ